MTLDVTEQDNDVDTERRILMGAVALVDDSGAPLPNVSCTLSAVQATVRVGMSSRARHF